MAATSKRGCSRTDGYSCFAETRCDTTLHEPDDSLPHCFREEGWNEGRAMPLYDAASSMRLSAMLALALVRKRAGTELPGMVRIKDEDSLTGERD